MIFSFLCPLTPRSLECGNMRHATQSPPSSAELSQMASYCRYIKSMHVSSRCHRVNLCASEGNMEGHRDKMLMGPENGLGTAELTVKHSTNVFWSYKCIKSGGDFQSGGSKQPVNTGRLLEPRPVLIGRGGIPWSETHRLPPASTSYAGVAR